MAKIYSYVLRIDDGAAPNPFGGICTLAICKPVIRRYAQVGDWVMGTGSKNAKLNDGEIYDFAGDVVYAMKITRIMSLKEYDAYCRQFLQSKIPDWKQTDWKQRVGDCIYDYSKGEYPELRKSVHCECNRTRDLGGKNVLLSEHFYYFGVEARSLPVELRELVKKNQGHKKIEREDLLEEFEKWIAQFQENALYAEPQMPWIIDKKGSCGCGNVSHGKEDEAIKPIC